MFVLNTGWENLPSRYCIDILPESTDYSVVGHIEST